MKHTRWFYHPLFVFIFSILALVLSLFLSIYWYTKASKNLETIARKFNIDPQQVLKSETWMVILVLSILVGIILIGIFAIFVYSQKTVQLYRLQHNFINSFTHELKTPVTSLKLFLETFLKHDIPRTDQITYIRYMLQDVGRLSDNISRILNLARIESKSYAGAFVDSDMVQLVKDFITENHHLFEGCQIEIHDPDDAPFTYTVNVPLFEMFLINIFTNAIKYNTSRTPRIDIVFERQKQRLAVHFRDNGIGIPKTEIKRIFKKFYQVGRSDDMTAKGSGLGLYLVQNIARLHKGRVIASSDGPGEGAVFTLLLPRRR
ncbi:MULTISPECIES: sensor histidine kinase [Desulfococcus]|jgi:signal transduction histidine kinase|uniref:histidine kinase n=1 Tax=Desulfococcus multivorans DSM 2059 TaxID=1121405 RepID=S7UP93_DESML|nr:HAMP domain-containing sensor histidine kinase [Desulfococcus multivorans]AOY59496.1 two component system sensor histidine kinase [Desulfococcus multivorans]AQV01695.1 two-component sensor histidine kinase [Desulfococcus multivorans]EPR34143.1 integral membrane sensor signal transduction histidine kinase [Desulfococcus multivorans DSM 2059]MDX9818184.1 HAMP domain-containing sensor histidine kinase [Desulfococcus multivorans]SKA19421.1 histidine kinase [Desulfococcus multivorans DSM 2059]